MTKSKPFVVDTSVLIKWVNRIDEQSLTQSDALLDHFEIGKITVHTPLLLKYEVGNALLKGKRLTIAQAEDALEGFYKLPILYSDCNEIDAVNIYELAHKYDITYYDATFLALARALRCPLVTANPKHQKDTSEIKVIPLKNYK